MFRNQWIQLCVLAGLITGMFALAYQIEMKARPPTGKQGEVVKGEHAH